MFKEKILSFFDKHYKVLMLIPIIITLLSLLVIGSLYHKTGDFFYKDVSISGGISVTVYTDKQITESQIQQAIPNSNVRILTEFGTSKSVGFIVDSPSLTKNKIVSIFQDKLDIQITDENSSTKESTAQFGGPFFKQLLIAIILAFIFMAITVFITFRSPAPSLAVIAAAAMDIIITLGVVDILGIRISSAGIISFLLIIGYSIDTDILLTNWAIRKQGEGPLLERMWHSMVTGLTMTLCAFVVMLAGLLFSNSPIIIEMFSIVLIALIVDVISTYLTNAGILYIWCKKKGIQ